MLTMDPALGDLSRGDIHVRDGEIIAVGTDLAAPSAEAIDGRDRIALPGFIDTHWHLWGSSLRSLIGDGEMDYFSVMSRIGPQFTPEDNYRGVRLGLAEGLHSGITTVHNWSHNLLSPAHADAELRALSDVGVRSRFSYGYSRTLQTQPDRLTDFDDVARVQREWFAGPDEGLLTMGYRLARPAVHLPRPVPPRVGDGPLAGSSHYPARLAFARGSRAPPCDRSAGAGGPPRSGRPSPFTPTRLLQLSTS